MVKDGSKKNWSLIGFFKLFLRYVKVETVNFMVFFGGFRDAPPACPIITTRIFLGMKALMKIHNRGKFH